MSTLKKGFITAGSKLFTGRDLAAATPASGFRALFFKVMAWLLFGFAGIWSCLAVNFSNLPWGWLRALLSWGLFVAIIVVMALGKKRGLTALCFLPLFIGIFIWYLLIPAPDEDSKWRSGNRLLPSAVLNGDILEISDLRDFKYRSESDYTENYVNRRYDLSKLDSLDVLLSYWDGNTAVAHFMLSFGFADKTYICVSVETRVREGEPQTSLRGLFKRYGVICILADEEDLVKLRTDFRKEDVYLYRLKLSQLEIKAIFLDVLRRMNLLKKHSVYYNTLTFNCFTSLIPSLCAAEPGSRWDYRMVMNGYLDRLLWEKGLIEGSQLPFKTLKGISHINSYAAKSSGNYSGRIRTGLRLIRNDPAQLKPGGDSARSGN